MSRPLSHRYPRISNDPPKRRIRRQRWVWPFGLLNISVIMMVMAVDFSPV